MSERITIDIVGREVGIQYHPETPEAALREEMRALELGLHALAAQAIANRIAHGIPVPPALTAFFEAYTFRDLL